MTDTRTILVTGASGYIAGWIVRYLLEAGHTVHATVRDPDNEDSVGHLRAIADSAPGTLRLFRADLLAPGSFDAAMAGCEIVMHTASPFIIEGFTDAREALVRPAVEGTRNVLTSVERTDSVRRVVLTSSVAAIYGDARDFVRSGKPALDESDWNTTSSVDHNPYQFSKAEAEREAWRMQRAQQRWELVTINPGMVYGPSLTSASKSASIDTLRQLGSGQLRTGVPDLRYGVVDVRDVARAHLLAAFEPAAEGRYILVNEVLSMLAIANILRQGFPRYPLPRMRVPKPVVWAIGPLLGPVTRRFIRLNVGYPLAFDNRRSLALGVRYRPSSETLLEHFEQAVNDGIIRRRG